MDTSLASPLQKFLRAPLHVNDCFQIRTKNDPYVPHLSSEFQLFTFSCFEVLAFLTFGCRIRNFPRKKHMDFQREASRKPKKKKTANMAAATARLTFFSKGLKISCNEMTSQITKKTCDYVKKHS